MYIYIYIYTHTYTTPLRLPLPRLCAVVASGPAVCKQWIRDLSVWTLVSYSFARMVFVNFVGQFLIQGYPKPCRPFHNAHGRYHMPLLLTIVVRS